VSAVTDGLAVVGDLGGALACPVAHVGQGLDRGLRQEGANLISLATTFSQEHRSYLVKRLVELSAHLA
jgi:hypothetical protein